MNGLDDDLFVLPSKKIHGGVIINTPKYPDGIYDIRFQMPPLWKGTALYNEINEETNGIEFDGPPLDVYEHHDCNGVRPQSVLQGFSIFAREKAPEILTAPLTFLAGELPAGQRTLAGFQLSYRSKVIVIHSTPFQGTQWDDTPPKLKIAVDPKLHDSRARATYAFEVQATDNSGLPVQVIWMDSKCAREGTDERKFTCGPNSYATNGPVKFCTPLPETFKIDFMPLQPGTVRRVQFLAIDAQGNTTYQYVDLPTPSGTEAKKKK